MSIQQLLLGASGASGYNLDRSLRFRSSASAYLNRTYVAAPTDYRKFTFSAWVKLGALGVSRRLLDAGFGSDTGLLNIGTDGSLSFGMVAAGAGTDHLKTNNLLRDPSAWYHIVFSCDTSVGSNQFKYYINGVQASYSINSSIIINYGTGLNSALALAQLGRSATYGQYFDGYMTEINFIDGQALTPASFGSTNALTGVWQPKAYTGTYGTNGFYLKFTSNSTAAALGTDFSGNGNTWTVNNISITAGVTYDSMTDVPTLTNATTANYAVMNPLYQPSGSGAVSFGSGNLLIGPVASSQRDNCGASMLMSSTGYWYAEFTGSGASSGNNNMIGIVGESDLGLITSGNFVGVTANSYGYLDQGNLRNNNTTSQTVSTMGTTPVVMVAFGNGKLWWGLNGTWLGTGSPNPSTATSPAYSGLTGNYGFAISTYNTSGGLPWNANFGQRPFAYTPPTGFVALNTFNLPTASILKGNTVMDAVTWSGNSTSPRNITGLNFKPDLVWDKIRSSAFDHMLFDSVRGAGTGKDLSSNATAAEGTKSSYGFLNSFNSDGFTVNVGTDPSFPYAAFNQSGQTYVAWAWNAGSGSSSSNTNGSITSTVSVNAAAGFSVVTYTGTGANATVGHGLGVAPSMIINKPRNAADGWAVYHTSIGNTNFLSLNTNNASSSSIFAWNNTSPTSSVFSVNTDGSNFTNVSGRTYVSYCFSAIAGYSAFGTYTGNGSTDGPFIYLGFEPKFILAKRTNTTGNWNILDGVRDPYNAVGKYIYANAADAEGANASTLDFTANGFKLRQTFGDWNASGSTYIYMAFAENPFKNSLAR